MPVSSDHSTCDIRISFVDHRNTMACGPGTSRCCSGLIFWKNLEPPPLLESELVASASQNQFNSISLNQQLLLRRKGFSRSCCRSPSTGSAWLSFTLQEFVSSSGALIFASQYLNVMTCGCCFYLSHFAVFYSGIFVSALPRTDNFAKRPKHNDNDNIQNVWWTDLA